MKLWNRALCARRGHTAWQLAGTHSAVGLVYITWRCGRCGHEDHYIGRLV